MRTGYKGFLAGAFLAASLLGAPMQASASLDNNKAKISFAEQYVAAASEEEGLTVDLTDAIGEGIDLKTITVGEWSDLPGDKKFPALIEMASKFEQVLWSENYPNGKTKAPDVLQTHRDLYRYFSEHVFSLAGEAEEFLAFALALEQLHEPDERLADAFLAEISYHIENKAPEWLAANTSASNKYAGIQTQAPGVN